MENVKEFYRALSIDAAMRERAKALNDKSKPADEAEAAATIIAFAKSEGYDFTAEELKAAASAKELSDEELENVAGGGGCGDPSCFCAVGGYGKQGNVDCTCVMAGGGPSPRPGLACCVGGVAKPY